MTTVQYIKTELSVQERSFLKDWKELTEEDKNELKQYAAEEMEKKGIEISGLKS